MDRGNCQSTGNPRVRRCLNSTSQKKKKVAFSSASTCMGCKYVAPNLLCKTLLESSHGNKWNRWVGEVHPYIRNLIPTFSRLFIFFTYSPQRINGDTPIRLKFVVNFLEIELNKMGRKLRDPRELMEHKERKMRCRKTTMIEWYSYEAHNTNCNNAHQFLTWYNDYIVINSGGGGRFFKLDFSKIGLRHMQRKPRLLVHLTRTCSLTCFYVLFLQQFIITKAYPAHISSKNLLKETIQRSWDKRDVYHAS
jgi:hypothetical protein